MKMVTAGTKTLHMIVIQSSPHDWGSHGSRWTTYQTLSTVFYTIASMDMEGRTIEESKSRVSGFLSTSREIKMPDNINKVENTN